MDVVIRYLIFLCLTGELLHLGFSKGVNSWRWASLIFVWFWIFMLLIKPFAFTPFVAPIDYLAGFITSVGTAIIVALLIHFLSGGFSS